MECLQTFIIWVEAILIFCIFQWYIAIFLWIGAFIIDYYIFKRAYIKNKDQKCYIDRAFLINVFLSSLICIFLPQIFVKIKLPGALLKCNDVLWMRYLNNTLCIAGVLFVFYSIGFRPWSWQHRLISSIRKSEDKIDSIDRLIDIIICIALFFLVQIVYGIFYFK